MDVTNVRRASSAGYRLPERSNGSRPKEKSQLPAAERTRTAPEERSPDPDRSNPVTQDRVWRERERSERRGVLEWEMKWSFLRNYDQMGQLRSEEPLPTNVSIFSDRIPNTTNQMLGSRLSTPLAHELVRLDRLFIWPASHRKHKQDPEMLPC